MLRLRIASYCVSLSMFVVVTAVGSLLSKDVGATGITDIPARNLFL